MSDLSEQRFWARAPFAHQARALEWATGREYFALLAEQGTGKCWIVNANAVRLWASKQISGVLVCAPNGVHANWLLNEVPQDMPSWVNWRAAAYYAGMNLKEKAAIERVMAPAAEGETPPLRYFMINWEALNTDEGLLAARQFANLMWRRGRGLYIVADESQRIKNPAAKRSKKFHRYLKPCGKFRSILSGTPVINSPWDAYSQFTALSDKIFDTDSFVAFKSEYAELEPPSQFGAMRHILQRLRPGKSWEDIRQELETPGNHLVKSLPTIVKRDPVTGLPRWRNLEKLEALIKPHSFRVLKSECLDLPPKVYSQSIFRMTKMQRTAYERARDDLRLMLESGEETPISRLAAVTKLSQIVSGYFIVPGTDGQVERIMPFENNPKLAVLAEELESAVNKEGAQQQVIIWARFQHEIADVVQLCGKLGIACVQYHGSVSRNERQLAIEAFKSGTAPVFIAQQQAGSTGLTLIAPNSVADTMSVIYYSNTWSLEDRLQSEDRAHRIGQQKTVRYLDIIAMDSCDGAIVAALRNKQDVASIIVGDAHHVRDTLGLDL